MEISTAVKKLNKHGFSRMGSRGYVFRKFDYLIEFKRNGGTDDVTCITYRHIKAGDDVACDSLYCKNLTQAINAVIRQD